MTAAAHLIPDICLPLPFLLLDPAAACMHIFICFRVCAKLQPVSLIMPFACAICAAVLTSCSMQNPGCTASGSSAVELAEAYCLMGHMPVLCRISVFMAAHLHPRRQLSLHKSYNCLLFIFCITFSMRLSEGILSCS